MGSAPPATDDETPVAEESSGVRERIEGLTPRRVGLYAVLGFLVVFYLAPLEAGIVTAFKDTDAFARTIPFLPPGPGGFTLDAWGVAVNTLAPTMVNSLILAVPATILSALFGSLAAYGLTHIDWRGQIGIVVLFVAGIFLPYQAVLVPITEFWTNVVDTKELLAPLLGVVLYDGSLPLVGDVYISTFPYHAELLNLIITHTAYGIPITTLLFRSYYQGFSTEMLEAARLDGASTFSIYRNIVLPLSLPMFAVTLIYQFTQIWNDLLFALVLLNDSRGYVVMQGLNALTGGIVQSFNTQMAGAFIAALPTLLVYVFFGDKFARGVAG